MSITKLNDKLTEKAQMKKGLGIKYCFQSTDSIVPRLCLCNTYWNSHCSVLAASEKHTDKVSPAGNPSVQLRLFIEPSAMNRILIILSSLLLGHATAPAQSLEWGFTYDSVHWLNTTHIDATADGGVLVGGIFGNYADLDPSAGSNLVFSNSSSPVTQQIYLSRFDASGAYQWGWSIGGSGTSLILDMKVDHLGNIYLFFRSSALVLDVDPGLGVYNVFPFAGTGSNQALYVAKYDPVGAFIWVREFQVVTDQSAFITTGKMGTHADGSVTIASLAIDSVDMDPGPDTTYLVSNDAKSLFLARLDSSGAMLWYKHLPALDAPSPVFLNDILAYADGSFYLTALFNGTIDIDPDTTATVSVGSSSSIQWGSFLARYNNNGELMQHWSTTRSNSARLDFNTVDTLMNGELVVTTTTKGNQDMDPGPGVLQVTSPGSFDVTVLHLNDSLEVLDGFLIGGASSENVREATIDAYDRLWMTGTFMDTMDIDPGPSTYSIDHSTGPTWTDQFITCHGMDGTPFWGGKIASPKNEQTSGMVFDGNAAVYIAGYAGDTCDADPTSGYLPTDGYTSTDLVLLRDQDGNRLTDNGATGARQ